MIEAGQQCMSGWFSVLLEWSSQKEMYWIACPVNVRKSVGELATYIRVHVVV